MDSRTLAVSLIDELDSSINTQSSLSESVNRPDDSVYDISSRSMLAEDLPTQDEAKGCLARYKPSLWNAAGGMTGTFVWMLFYYVFVELKKNVEIPEVPRYLLYVVNSILQGIFANLAAKPFIKRACIAEGDTEEEAEKASSKYAKIYIPVDAQFEVNLDLSIAFAHMIETGIFTFHQEDEPVFSSTEIALMAAMTISLTCSAHFFMSKYLQNETSYMESVFKIFLLTMAFYSTDYIFDVDFNPEVSALTKTLPHLVGSLAMMGVSYVLVDMLAEKVIAVKNKCFPATLDIEEIDDLEKNVVKTNSVNGLSGTLGAPLLSSLQQQSVSDDEAQERPLRESCCHKFFSFFRSGRAIPLKNDVKVDSAVASLGR